jgi:DNA-binding transcriptional LysR family regulator
VCSPALLRDRGRPLVRPSDLSQHLLLKSAPAVHSPMPAGMPNEWPSWLAAAGVPDREPAGGLVFNQFDGAVAAALAGQGVLLGRRPVVDALLARGELVTPFAGELASARGYAIVVEPNATRRPAVQALQQWLLAQAAAEPPAATAAGAAAAEASGPAEPSGAADPSEPSRPERRARSTTIGGFRTARRRGDLR